MTIFKFSDCWSMGVLLCLLLSGRLPFAGSIQTIYKRIGVADYSVSILKLNR